MFQNEKQFQRLFIKTFPEYQTTLSKVSYNYVHLDYFEKFIGVVSIQLAYNNLYEALNLFYCKKIKRIHKE